MTNSNVQPSYGEDVDLIPDEIASPFFEAYPPCGAQNEKDARIALHILALSKCLGPNSRILAPIGLFLLLGNIF